MKDALLRAFLIGCKISLEYDHGKCYIRCEHPVTLNARDQYFELDDNCEQGFTIAIDYCVRELLKNTDIKEISE